MSEGKKRALIIFGGGALIIALYYYLRNTSGPQQVTYPNTQASGVPQSQNAGSQYNISVPAPAPNPGLIYNPPMLPATPAFMSYNNAPVSIMGPTSIGPITVSPAKDCGGECGGCCGCSTCATGGTYLDGNRQPCLAPSPSAPRIPANNPTLMANVASIASFFGMNAVPVVPGGPTPGL